MRVTHRKVLLKFELKVEGVRNVCFLKAWLFALPSTFSFGESEHVDLPAIKCQHPAPFILLNPCVLGVLSCALFELHTQF